MIVPRNKFNYSSSLHKAMMNYMPSFILHINPIIHSTRYRGERITENQIKVIMLLFHKGKTSPGTISFMLNIQKGSLTGVLKSLRAMDMIQRVQIDGDERSYIVSLTGTGFDFVYYHRSECDRRMERLFSEMKDDEKNTIESGLSALTRYLDTRGKNDERP